MSSQFAVPLLSLRVALHVFFLIAVTVLSSSAQEAPGRLRAKAISSSEIRMTWKDRSRREEGFKIERSLSPKDGFEEIATVDRGVTFYVDSGLAPSTRYYYRVCSFRTHRQSSWSNVDPATTQD